MSFFCKFVTIVLDCLRLFDYFVFLLTNMMVVSFPTVCFAFDGNYVGGFMSAWSCLVPQLVGFLNKL